MECMQMKHIIFDIKSSISEPLGEKKVEECDISLCTIKNTSLISIDKMFLQKLYFLLILSNVFNIM